MPRLSEEQRNRATGMLMPGVAVNAVSQAFGYTKQTIHKLMTCYMETAIVLPSPAVSPYQNPTEHVWDELDALI